MIAISDDSSWEEVDRYTDAGTETAKEWTRVQPTMNMEDQTTSGQGAAGPASKREASTQSRNPRAPEQQGYRGGAGLGRGVLPQRF